MEAPVEAPVRRARRARAAAPAVPLAWRAAPPWRRRRHDRARRRSRGPDREVRQHAWPWPPRGAVSARASVPVSVGPEQRPRARSDLAGFDAADGGTARASGGGTFATDTCAGTGGASVSSTGDVVNPRYSANVASAHAAAKNTATHAERRAPAVSGSGGRAAGNGSGGSTVASAVAAIESSMDSAPTRDSSGTTGGVVTAGASGTAGPGRCGGSIGTTSGRTRGAAPRARQSPNVGLIRRGASRAGSGPTRSDPTASVPAVSVVGGSMRGGSASL